MVAILKHLKPYSWSIVLIATLTLCAILLELFLPTLMSGVVDHGIVNQDIPYILQTGGWMIACSILAILLTISSMFFSSRVALGFGKDVRRKLFVRAENFSLSEFEKIGPASLITRTTNDIKQVQDVLNMMLSMMTRAPLMLIGGIILAVSREPKLSLIFLGALPVLLVSILLIARKAIPLFGVLQKRTDRLNLILRESLIGTRVIRAFNRVDFEKQRFNTANHDYRDTGIRVNKIIAFLPPVMILVMSLTNVAIIWFGAIQLDQGALQVGNLMAFLQYAMMILIALVMMTMAFIMIPRAQASAKRINEVLQLTPSMKDEEAEKPNSALKGYIEFKHVTFRYEGAEKAAIEDISFSARPGQTTAIIGSTGSGKTSLIQLIPRFYDIESGTILINGVDIKKISQQALRQKIGYVPQRASLFSGTIAENIRYGKEDASEDDILEALDIAQASEFVNEKEHGIETYIEQAGANLSGGQKQRVSIARALVRKPEIYIFDDSFSALDYKTDARLRQALAANTGDATIILVAQRVSTVVDADQIIVLDEGKVAGIGTHKQLLQTSTIYQEIVSSQQSEEESAS